jgi:LAGLIDADG endonuclease
LLNIIQSFFGGIGTITINPNKNSARYSVVGLKDINNYIIPHFEKYPLQSVKKIDYDL